MPRNKTGPFLLNGKTANELSKDPRCEVCAKTLLERLREGVPLLEAFKIITRRKNLVLRVGTPFERWTTIGQPFWASAYNRAKKHNNTNVPIYEWWVVCQCQCDRIAVKMVSELQSGHAKSCGCLGAEMLKGRSKHRQSRSALYNCWILMKRNGPVCKAWSRNYDTFNRWALANGYEKGLCLTRKNRDKPYSSSNCLFVTKKEIANNRRSRNIKITIDGVTKTAAQWSEAEGCCVSQEVIAIRIACGYDPAIAVFEKSLVKSKVMAWGETKSITDWFSDGRNNCPNISTLSARLRAGFSPERAISLPLDRFEMLQERRRMKWRRLSLFFGL